MTNKKDFTILEKIEFLKQLKDEDKEILLDLINDKNTKIERIDSFNRRTIPTLQISNQNHKLKIEYRPLVYNDYTDTIKVKDKDFLIKDTIANLTSHRTIKTINDVIFDVTGNFNYLFYENMFLSQTDDNIFNVQYKFYLDDKLIGAKVYNADLVYFLKNTKKYNPLFIKDFFSNDLESFNKEIYDILSLFNARQDFVSFDVYGNFNNAFSDYLEDSMLDLNNPCFLNAIYFKAVCVPKLQELIKPNLDNLAKNNLHYQLEVIELNDESCIFNTDIPFKTFKIRIAKILTKEQFMQEFDNNTLIFYNKDLDFSFYDVVYNDYNGWNDFENEMKELDNKIIEIANDINKYLQFNHVVAYNKIHNHLNYCINNEHLNDINSDKVYASSFLNFDYGHLTNVKEITEVGDINNSQVLLWKYCNDILSFGFFDVFNLSVMLAKNKEDEDYWNKIPLKNEIKDAKLFNKISYRIKDGVIAFKIAISNDLPEPNEEEEVWKNKQYEESRLDANNYTKYANFVKDIWVNAEKKIKLRFEIPTNQGLDINNIMHDIYNEFKDKIILKEKVQEKIEKSIKK